MKRLLPILIFTALSCAPADHDFEYGPDAMKMPRQSAPVLVSKTQPAPDTAALPAEGYFNQNVALPPSTLHPTAANNLVGEIIMAQQELGFEQSTELDGRDALAEVFTQGHLPPASTFVLVSGDDATTDRVPSVDIGLQEGWYIVQGSVVGFHFRVNWTNQNAAVDGHTVRIDLPYQTGPNSEDLAVGDVFLPNLQLRTDNGALGASYTISTPTVNDARAELFVWTTPGAAPTAATLGDGDIEGAKTVEGEIWYRTNGVRNTRWPMARWTEITNVHVPIGSIPPTIIKWRVDGAQPGDFVQLFKDPGPVLVAGSAIAVVNTPKERGQFNLTSLGQPPGVNYYVEINGFLSRPYAVT